jgi:hypothetical protein
VPNENEPAKRRNFDPAIVEASVSHLFSFLQTALPKMEETLVLSEVSGRRPSGAARLTSRQTSKDQFEKLMLAVGPERKDSVRNRLKALTVRSKKLAGTASKATGASSGSAGACAGRASGPPTHAAIGQSSPAAA